MRSTETQLQNKVTYLLDEIQAWKIANRRVEERIQCQINDINALKERLFVPQKSTVSNSPIMDATVLIHSSPDGLFRFTPHSIRRLLQEIETLKKINAELVGRGTELTDELRLLRERHDALTVRPTAAPGTIYTSRRRPSAALYSRLTMVVSEDNLTPTETPLNFTL